MTRRVGCYALINEQPGFRNVTLSSVLVPLNVLAAFLIGFSLLGFLVCSFYGEPSMGFEIALGLFNLKYMQLPSGIRTTLAVVNWSAAVVFLLVAVKKCRA